MLLDPRKLREVLEAAAGPLVALGALIGAVTAGVKWLTPVLEAYTDRAVAAPLAISVSLFAACACLWAAYRALAKRSRLLRLERFDLRVRKRDELLGRDEEIANLKGLIDGSSLLLVDGESGCGKSSLVAFGLIPALREDPSACPMLVSYYPGDWDVGLAQRIFEAAWSGLSAEERAKVGFGDRPAIGTVGAETVRTILERIGTTLGRMPILILDQFDDYQLATREHFLGRRKDWIKPSDLVRRNRTWATIRDLLHTEKARLLVVTRSDASAGLHSIRFTDQADGLTVGRLKAEWLVQWLGQVTADDGKGEVIANPDFGWTDLKKQLERDLTPHGTSSGVVLPQQVRIVFLGLRKLRSLTPSEYRRAVAGAGVEALYIRDAIASAALESGLTVADVRSLLSAFLERVQANGVKTKVLSLADMAPMIPDTGRLQKALNRLERDEVVREKPASGDEGRRWQLDHDYIAPAVVAESRAADKLSLLLQDGGDAWRMAGNNIRQRYRSLLPLSVQIKLAWMRLRSRGEFVYRPYRLYAALSTLRVLPVVLLLAGAGWLWREETLRAAAMQIVDYLNEGFQGADAAIALWRASPAVRIRVVDRLLDSPGRLRNAGTDWVIAFTSIEPHAAQDLMIRLITRLDRPNVDATMQRLLIAALGRVGARLDAVEAAKAVTDLRARLDRPNVDAATQRSLIDALGRVGAGLDAAEAAKTATDLIARLERPNVDFFKQQLIDALGRVGARLDAAEAAKAVTDLIARLDRPNVDADLTRRLLIDALGLVGARLDAAEAAKAATDLRARLDRPNVDAPTRRVLVAALGHVGARLDAAEAAKAVTDLIGLDRPNVIADLTQRLLIDALGRVGARLDAAEAAKGMTDLIARLDRPIEDVDTLIAALGRVGARLDAAETAKVVTDLRARLDRPNVYADTQRLLIVALGRVGAGLDAAEAAKAVTDLIARLDRPNVDAYSRGLLIDALGLVGAGLDAAEAAKAATDLRARLDRPDVDVDTQRFLIAALGRVGARLDAAEAAKAATDLRARLDRPNVNAFTRVSLIDALGRVGARLDAAEAAKTATDLIAQLDRPNVDATTQRSLIDALDRPNVTAGLTRVSLIDALGRVGARLDAAEAAKAATDLIARLDRPNVDATTQRSLIDAVASIAVVPSPHPTDEQISSIRIALGSVAWPLRDPSESPAWSRLETISGKKFDRDVERLLLWANYCCKLSPCAARPTFAQ
jgi:hypothetical protein